MILTRNDLINRIKALKKEQNAIILAHCYQNIEIDEVADFVGDSLKLSRLAAQTEAKTIVFAGVYFMAETAKILSPEKKVLLPSENAGCKMADMVDTEQIKEFKMLSPGAPVVCYVNSSAAVKAESDICCTSANAVEIVKSLNAEKILFVPDTYLGGYVASMLPNIDIIRYPGYCPVHLGILPEEIDKLKELYPDAKVLVHPECPKVITDRADYIGSTTGIMQYATESDAEEFIIATETAVVKRLEKILHGKTFYAASQNAICADMKQTKLEDILRSLENGTYEVTVPEDIAAGARSAIDKMIALG